jgi:CMP-N-acetylneuraminic acid synthetase
MKIIALIPARGGSKRLPGKNIRDFCGKPLIYYSIKAAQSCDKIQEVYVSTDDAGIAEISKNLGAKVILRPENISGDTATTTSVIEHAISKIDAGISAVITLQPTNPVREIMLLAQCIETFIGKSTEIDSLITVSQNKHKLGKIHENYFEPCSYHLEERSQDLEKLYYENGLVYISKISTLIDQQSIFGKRIYPYIVEGIFGDVDIDTLADFELAGLIFEKYKQKLVQ